MLTIKPQIYDIGQAGVVYRDKALIDNRRMDTSPEAVKARINEAFELLAQKGKKKAEVARECGVYPQTLNNWINNGQVSRENVYQLAKALDCNTDWLLAGVGERKRNQGPVNKRRLRQVLDLLFSTAQAVQFDLSHIPAHHGANIVALAYDILGDQNKDEEEALRIVRRVIESMLEQATVENEQTRGTAQ